MFVFKTLDAFFRLFIIFLVCFVWIRYFVDSFWISLAITLLISLSIDILYTFFKNKKNNKLNIKKEEENKIEGYINTFIYSDKKYCVDFFYELCKKKYNCIKKSNFIVIEHTNSTIVLYPMFLFRDFSIDDLIETVNKTKAHKPNRIVICTNKIALNLDKFSKTFPMEIVILDGQQTYFSLLKKYQFYPKITKFNNEQKINFKQFITIATDKKRAKSYFISALFLLFSSFFVSYKIYYLVFSTILLIMCFICLRPNKTKPQTSSNILE